MVKNQKVICVELQKPMILSHVAINCLLRLHELKYINHHLNDLF